VHIGSLPDTIGGSLNMVITVFFENESPSHSDIVAQFDSEELYMACLPALEKMATNMNMIVSESVNEDQYLEVSWENDCP
jgi:hypothetical protein